MEICPILFKIYKTVVKILPRFSSKEYRKTHFFMFFFKKNEKKVYRKQV